MTYNESSDGQQSPGVLGSSEELASYFAAIVEWSDDAIVSKSLDGIVRSWNPGAERIFGYTAQEMVGESIRRLIPEHLQDEEDEVLRRVRAGLPVDHFETIRQRKDGSLVPISLTVSPIKNGRGEIIGASKIARDISERRVAEDAVRTSMALKDQFLGLVSHELRTPVATVVGNAQLLLRRGDRIASAQRQEALADIASEAERLQAIIEDLLILTRLGTREDIEFEDVDLAALVADVVRRQRSRARREYHVDVRDEGLRVRGSETLLQLVVRNLLANAVKYSPPDTPIEVVVERSTGGDAVVLVHDRGVGVSDEDAAHVFEPFYRSAAIRAEVPGIGLGLAVCERAMDAQSGWVALRPRPGGGSTFSFGLPVSDPA